MTAPAATATQRPSVVEDIVDVFYQPSAVFERRRNAGFSVAWLIYAILTAAMIYAGQPVLRPMMALKRDQAIEKITANPQLSAEQKESIGNRIRSGFDSPWAVAGQMVLIPLTVFVTALVLWLCGKAFGSAATYGQAAMVTTFAAFPRLLLSALVTAYSLAVGRETLSQYGLLLSPASLLPDDASPLTSAMLSRLDLGTLWMTALLGIGLAIVGRISRRSGLTAAGIVWLIAGGFVVLTALREMAG